MCKSLSVPEVNFLMFYEADSIFFSMIMEEVYSICFINEAEKSVTLWAFIVLQKNIGTLLEIVHFHLRPHPSLFIVLYRPTTRRCLNFVSA
jgi:DMSO reductase anchor subunit